MSRAIIFDELKDLSLAGSWDREIEIISNHIKQTAKKGEILKILEAGCGQKWNVELDGIEFFLTGLDLDEKALEIRKNTLNDLDEVVIADLRGVEFPEKAFDVIFSSYVLEHIKDANKVLENFAKWLKPNGILIIQIPDRDSVYGLITRLSPHWFHVFFYRYILGQENAGKPGYGPYITYHDQVVSRQGIRKFCQDNSLTLIEEFGDGYIEQGRGIVRDAIKAFKRVVNILSLDTFSSSHVNLTFIIRKKSG